MCAGFKCKHFESVCNVITMIQNINYAFEAVWAQGMSLLVLIYYSLAQLATAVRSSWCPNVSTATAHELHRNTTRKIDLRLSDLAKHYMTFLQCDHLSLWSNVRGARAPLLPLRAFFCSFMVSDDFFLISCRDLLYS